MSLRTWYLRKKFWANDFIHGSELYRQYRDVGDISENKGDCSYRRRTELLESILKYATRHVPFYKGMRWSSLSDFPIINKNIILQDYDRFLAPPAVIPGHEGPLHVQRTSGSTGIPFSIPLDRRCRLRRIATLKYYNSLLGHKSCEPMMHIRTAIRDRYDKFNNIYYVSHAKINNKDDISYIIDTINKNKITLVRAHMSILNTLIRHSNKNGHLFEHNVDFISTGEMLSPRLLDMIIKNNSGNRIVSQYAAEEIGVLGQTSINGNGSVFNLNKSNVYIEILDLEKDNNLKSNKSGRVVITDFTNYAMPLIRYDIGDIASVFSYNKYGDISAINKFSGRKTDIIYTSSGEYVDFINNFIPYTLKIERMLQWQFVQNTKNKYTFKLVMDGCKINEKECIDYIKNILGADAFINIEYVDELPVLSSGKRKLILNEWKR